MRYSINSMSSRNIAQLLLERNIISGNRYLIQYPHISISCTDKWDDAQAMLSSLCGGCALSDVVRIVRAFQVIPRDKIGDSSKGVYSTHIPPGAG